MVGAWQGELTRSTGEVVETRSEFRLISDGNTLVETLIEDGVEMLTTAFEIKYGQQYADKIKQAWVVKEHQDDPRKPTYLLVQKPKEDNQLPQVFVACGKKDHDDTILQSIV